MSNPLQQTRPIRVRPPQRRLDKPLLAHLDALPPPIVYALGGRGRDPSERTMQALVKASGLSERTFLRIAKSASWGGIKVSNASAFCTACNVSVLFAAPYLLYLRKMAGAGLALPHLTAYRKPGVRRRLEELMERKRATPSLSPDNQSSPVRDSNRLQTA